MIFDVKKSEYGQYFRAAAEGMRDITRICRESLQMSSHWIKRNNIKMMEEKLKKEVQDAKSYY